MRSRSLDWSLGLTAVQVTILQALIEWRSQRNPKGARSHITSMYERFRPVATIGSIGCAVPSFDPAPRVIHPRSLGEALHTAQDAPMSYLATRVKLLREARRWTQQELASESRVSVTTISRYENGRVAMFSAKVLDRLSAALGVDPGLLIVKMK
jgi:DNA-binding Xre family transcriptional regulator